MPALAALNRILQSALDGFHVCLLAYGQTGSGKTHTMLGSDAGMSITGILRLHLRVGTERHHNPT